MKDYIDHLQICHQKVELYMHTPQDIHEYQLLLIQKEECCLRLEHSLKKKELLIGDVSTYCSLFEYLKNVKLNEQQFLCLCIQLLETIQLLMVDKIVYLDIRYFFIENTTGKLKCLCIPIVKYTYEEKAFHSFLYEFIQEVQVDKAYVLLGILVYTLKQKKICWADLLEEIKAYTKKRKTTTFFKKYIKRGKDESFYIPCPNSFLSCDQKKKSAYLKDRQEAIYLIRDHVVLGRSPTCDYVLKDTRISKQHVCIIWKDDQYFVKDLCSKNGTWLNSEKLEATKIYRLLHKDILRLASYSFIFYDE